jgi:dihydrofolate reductase
MDLPRRRRRVPDHAADGRLHARPLPGHRRRRHADQDRAGDQVIDVAGGEIGGQALRLGLIDQVVVNLVPAVLGPGRPFFATGLPADPLLLDNPSQIIRGDRVTHLVYDVAKS